MSLVLLLLHRQLQAEETCEDAHGGEAVLLSPLHVQVQPTRITQATPARTYGKQTKVYKNKNKLLLCKQSRRVRISVVFAKKLELNKCEE